MQRAPERPLRHGFPDSVPCSPQKQACEWLGRVLVGQDLSGTVGVACPPRDEPPPRGYLMLLSMKHPGRERGPGTQASFLTSRESPFRPPGPTSLSQKHPLVKRRTCPAGLGPQGSPQGWGSPFPGGRS